MSGRKSKSDKELVKAYEEFRSETAGHLGSIVCLVEAVTAGTKRKPTIQVTYRVTDKLSHLRRSLKAWRDNVRTALNGGEGPTSASRLAKSETVILDWSEEMRKLIARKRPTSLDHEEVVEQGTATSFVTSNTDLYNVIRTEPWRYTAVAQQPTVETPHSRSYPIDAGQSSDALDPDEGEDPGIDLSALAYALPMGEEAPYWGTQQ